jgi:hypothetical protein
VKLALKFSKRAPASTHSAIAVASSFGVALGTGSFADAVSEKIGRLSSVQPGQIAGAADSRVADRMPATKVPCMQATPSSREQALAN